MLSSLVEHAADSFEALLMFSKVAGGNQRRLHVPHNLCKLLGILPERLGCAGVHGQH